MIFLRVYLETYSFIFLLRLCELLIFGFTFLIVLVEVGWIIYYIFSGGSFFNGRIRSERNRPYSKIKLDILALFVWGISAFLEVHQGLIPSLKNASQERLFEHYQKHKAEFENAIVAIRSVRLSGDAQRLLLDLNLCGDYEVANDAKYEIKNYTANPVVYLYLYKDHIWANAGYEKGYAFSEKELAPQVQNIDKDPTEDNKMNYQKIDKNWYLFYYYW